MQCMTCLAAIEVPWPTTLLIINSVKYKSSERNQKSGGERGDAKRQAVNRQGRTRARHVERGCRHAEHTVRFTPAARHALWFAGSTQAVTYAFGYRGKRRPREASHDVIGLKAP